MVDLNETSPSSGLQWPDTSGAVRHLLAIQHGDMLRCHGRPKRNSTCGNQLGKSATVKIAELTGSVAASGRFNCRVSELLRELANAVMCRRWHQDQGVAKAEAWEQQLSSIASSSHRNQHEAASQHSRTSKTPDGREKPSQNSTPSSPPPGEFVCHRFEYYCREKSIFEVNLEVKYQLGRRLRGTEVYRGSIYAFNLPNSHNVNGKLSSSYAKIGFTNNFSRRLAEIRRACHYEPRVIGVWEIPNPLRYERIIHLLLSDVRMREPTGCPGCSVSHKEWFEFNRGVLCSLIRSWLQWAMRKPYSEDGHLQLLWQEKLNKLDLGSPTCWVPFLADKP
ncbi:hypothetical protein F4677DRAFT_430994 [Hypoxylon crocopeplum]|nr:hypothetical protein F4677DRAFT_430994 [Hypoxylon crocopeplum]